jgi:hypothetical protein
VCSASRRMEQDYGIIKMHLWLEINVVLGWELEKSENQYLIELIIISVLQYTHVIFFVDVTQNPLFVWNSHPQVLRLQIKDVPSSRTVRNVWGPVVERI